MMIENNEREYNPDERKEKLKKKENKKKKKIVLLFFFMMITAATLPSCYVWIQKAEFELPVIRVTGLTTGSAIAQYDHNNLNNLAWSVAGHYFDTDLDLGNYSLITTGNVSASYLIGNLSYEYIMNPPWLTSYVDTNATTECNGDEVLLGNGSCTSSGDFITKTYEVSILLTVSNGSGTATSPLINHELLQLIVIPSSSSNTYNFEAYETATGTTVDRNRIQHNGTWNILKNTAIHSSTLTFNITNTSIDETFNITLRYVK